MPAVAETKSPLSFKGAKISFSREQFTNLLRVSYDDAGVLKAKLDFHFQQPGKLIRPQLNFQLLQYLNVDTENAMSWSLVTEILHNASLIHDDLQDGDLYRRKQKSYWNQFGVSSAINAGDYLLMKSSLLIGRMQVTDQVKWRLSKLLMETAVDLVKGQEREEDLKNISETELWENYIKCIEEKTASLFLMAVGAAEVLQGKSTETQKLREIFLGFGTCFQLHDDLIDIVGDKGRESKANDLREGKWSSLVIKYITSQSSAKDDLIAFLNKPRNEVKDHEVESWVNEFYEKGIIKESMELLQNELGSLEEVLEDSPEVLKQSVSQLMQSSFSKELLNRGVV